jgi:hypothetical protein
MPRGLNRSGDFRNGSPVTTPIDFGTDITLPHDFGNDVTWPTPDPAHFGNAVTWLPNPAHFGNIITPPYPAPTFTSATPNHGPAAGGTSVAIVGSGFSVPGLEVLIGGAPCTSVVASDDTHLTCDSPAGSIGSTDIEILTDGGSVDTPAAWTYDAAAFTFVTSGSIDSSGTNPVILDTTGATLLLAVVAESGTTPVLVDSNSNTWNYLTVQTASGVQTSIAYAFAPVVGASHSFSLSSTCVGFVYAFGGPATTSACFLDQNGTTVTSANPQPGSVTPASGGVILSGIVGVLNDTSSATINDSFTGLLKRFSNLQGAAAYLLTTDTTPVSPTWTQGSGSTAAVIAAFYPA